MCPHQLRDFGGTLRDVAVQKHSQQQRCDLPESRAEQTGKMQRLHLQSDVAAVSDGIKGSSCFLTFPFADSPTLTRCLQGHMGLDLALTALGTACRTWLLSGELLQRWLLFGWLFKLNKPTGIFHTIWHMSPELHRSPNLFAVMFLQTHIARSNF